jgi:hypothetical protein
MIHFLQFEKGLRFWKLKSLIRNLDIGMMYPPSFDMAGWQTDPREDVGNYSMESNQIQSEVFEKNQRSEFQNRTLISLTPVVHQIAGR